MTAKTEDRRDPMQLPSRFCSLFVGSLSSKKPMEQRPLQRSLEQRSSFTSAFISRAMVHRYSGSFTARDRSRHFLLPVETPIDHEPNVLRIHWELDLLFRAKHRKLLGSRKYEAHSVNQSEFTVVIGTCLERERNICNWPCFQQCRGSSRVNVLQILFVITRLRIFFFSWKFIFLWIVEK